MIRLFVPDDLYGDARIAAGREQAHYLVSVMRLSVGDGLLLFNGRDGEWRAQVGEASKQACLVIVEAQTRPLAPGPDLDLIVALVKRSRLETIVEKAAELGARRVQPVITDRTNPSRINLARLTAIAIEAAEQTGRLDVPAVLAPRRLDQLLADWPGDRKLMFCDEAGEAAGAMEALCAAAGRSWAILIGPEGGFSAAERGRLRAHPATTAVSLGPRILRADTAAISAMSLWQSALGDWRGLRLGDGAPTSP
ncbi:MAG TPA: 16S rRNA (uracil(1498)-N(3))-methyltransferase [Caulobacteraceae bacterium]